MSSGYCEVSTSQSWMDRQRRRLEKVTATGRAPVTKMAGNAEVGHQYVGVERYVLRVKVRSKVRHESTKSERAVSEWPRHSPFRDLPTVVYRQY